MHLSHKLSCNVEKYYYTHFANEELRNSDLPKVTRNALDEHLSPHQHCNLLLSEPLSCTLVRPPLHFKPKSCFWCSAYPFPTTITNSQPAITNQLVFPYFYFPNPVKLFAASGPKKPCFVTRPLGFMFPEQCLICQKWRSLSSAATRQSTCLSCGSVELWQWRGLGVFFLLKLGPFLEDTYYCSYAQMPAYDQQTTVQRAVANKLSCHNQLGHAPRQPQAWSKARQPKQPSWYYNSNSAQRV